MTSPDAALRAFLAHAAGPTAAIRAAQLLALADRLPAQITECGFVDERDWKELIVHLRTGDLHIDASVMAGGSVRWEIFTGLEADRAAMNFPKLQFLEETAREDPPVERIVHTVARYRRGIINGQRLGPDPRCRAYAEAAERSQQIHERWMAGHQRNIMLGVTLGRLIVCHDPADEAHT